MRPVYEEFPEDITRLVDHVRQDRDSPGPSLDQLRHVVPDVGSKLKVSTPPNSQDLIYPFFVTEFKADGPGGSGSLWVATNQCLGASVSCVNVAECLNRQLRRCKSDKVQPIDSAAFSIAMSGTEARLYISWKHNELDYYMRKVKSFSLQEPEQYVEFRKHVRNIIDWGKDWRLKEIRKSLDSLLEGNRKIASQLAKRNSKVKTVPEDRNGRANESY
ncbi:hypothetical protein BJ875DRAFT_503484 [Amylocarpus encephaloides]|uniref:DUF7924 domain-containing protein n=1 Tax=Amylocarpus encephaloides TaxID=45428 RepID=A0A9P8C7G4_9HELO|nr:hypothetical protein BJ875DRAFT_503484 [Amylocarpus encephaloides]